MACVTAQGFQDGRTVILVPDVLRTAFALTRPCIVTVQLDPLIEMHLAGLDPESLAIRRVRSRASTAEDSEYWAIDLGTETQRPNANRTTNWTISPVPQFNDAALIAGRLRELIGLCQLPTVSLSWTPSPSPDVSGYNIYRSSVSGGPFTRLNPSPIPGTTYWDVTVESGLTYYYVSTAVDYTGAESAYSNEAVATIPPADVKSDREARPRE